MSKKSLYQDDIETAEIFIANHSADFELQKFLCNMKNRKDLLHSDRWSCCYDWLSEHYPAEAGTVVKYGIVDEVL